MHRTVALLIGMVIAATACAQAPKKNASKLDKRYGIEVNLDRYPQAKAKEALASVLKAVDAKNMEYLAAQLADPDFVDKRVKHYGGKFDEYVKEATDVLANNAENLKKLRRFLREGEWQEGENTASAQLKGVKERVYFRKLENRWFLEQRRYPEKSAK